MSGPRWVSEHDMERPDDLDACSHCRGFGEVGTEQDSFGVWQTKQCPFCGGTGERGFQ